jgi:hypothetical protein
MASLNDLIKQINASSATAQQKKNAIAAAKQAGKTGKGVSKNETTYILNNIATVTPKTLGTAASRIAANNAAGQTPAPTPAPTPTPTPTPNPVDEERQAFLEDAGTVFRETLKTVFPGSGNDTWINQLFEAAKPRLTVGFDTNDILDLMIQNGETPTVFNDRFKGIFELDRRRDAGEDVYVPKIAEYEAGREEYSRLMTRMGMSNLGTIENYGTLVGNDLSLDEVRDRITSAYDRVRGLDDNVLAGLREQFPSLRQQDLVQAVLTRESPNELANRITRSEIGVEAREAGVVSQLGAQALQERGVTRAQARQGFQSLAEYQRTAGEGIQQAQRMFGDTTSATEFQTELESEALLGQTSKTRKRLESQARAQFGGTSGIATGSLGRKKQV